MFSVAFVGCLPVGLSVSNITPKKYEWIAMKLMDRSGIINESKWINFGGNLHHIADCPIGNQAITHNL